MSENPKLSGTPTREKSATKRSRSSAIAVITSSRRSAFQFPVTARGSTNASEDYIEVTVGRNPKCDIVVDNKKVSSFHCVLRFKRVILQDSKNEWSLTIEPTSAPTNSTFLGQNKLLSATTISSFQAPVAVSLVFPEGDKSLDVLTITPVVNSKYEAKSFKTGNIDGRAGEPNSSTHSDKRIKKEIRELQKKNSEWETTYNEEINKLMELESSLLKEISLLDNSLLTKKVELSTLKDNVTKTEIDMQLREVSFSKELKELKDAHDLKYAELTSEIVAVTERISELQNRN